MKITILTLFPEMFAGPFDYSIVKRAQEKKLVKIELINLRDFGIGAHKMVDDTPYGGGVGMVLKVDVVHEAIEKAKSAFSENNKTGKQWVVLTSASGKPFKQQTAKHFSKVDHLIIICGHYEGVDERVMQYVDEEVSIGDFVLTGGELPSMIMTDSIVRLLEGAITEGAVEDESFSSEVPLLEYPHYTKPRSYEGHEVPEVLLSGNHQEIAKWRQEQATKKTKHVRPELITEKDN